MIEFFPLWILFRSSFSSRVQRRFTSIIERCWKKKYKYISTKENIFHFWNNFCCRSAESINILNILIEYSWLPFSCSELWITMVIWCKQKKCIHSHQMHSAIYSIRNEYINIYNVAEFSASMYIDNHCINSLFSSSQHFFFMKNIWIDVSYTYACSHNEMVKHNRIVWM